MNLMTADIISTMRMQIAVRNHVPYFVFVINRVNVPLCKAQPPRDGVGLRLASTCSWYPLTALQIRKAQGRKLKTSQPWLMQNSSTEYLIDSMMQPHMNSDRSYLQWTHLVLQVILMTELMGLYAISSLLLIRKQLPVRYRSPPPPPPTNTTVHWARMQDPSRHHSVMSPRHFTRVDSQLQQRLSRMLRQCVAFMEYGLGLAKCVLPL